MDFLQIFKAELIKESLKLLKIIKSTPASKVNKTLEAELTSFDKIFDDMFVAGKAFSNKIVQTELLRLVDTVKVPFKYNKQVIDNINNKSIFTGYYDEAYKGVFTKGELFKLKSTILSGTYNDLSEEQLANNIKSVISVSDKRAKLLARTERQRLKESTTEIYYSESKVSDQYDRVWESKEDNKVRQTHQNMDGKIAETEGDHKGQFYSEQYGWVGGPGSGPPEFSIGCRCSTRLVKKN